MLLNTKDQRNVALVWKCTVTRITLPIFAYYDYHDCFLWKVPSSNLDFRQVKSNFAVEKKKSPKSSC